MEQPPLRALPRVESKPGVRLVVAAVGAATVVVAAVLLPRLADGVDGWVAFAAFTPLVAAAQLAGVPTPRGYTIMVTGTGLVALAVLVPPELAFLAGLAALARHGRSGVTPVHSVFNACNEMLSVAAASAAAHAALPPAPGPAEFALAGLVATAVFVLVNDGLVSLVVTAAVGVHGADLRRSAREVAVPEATLASLGVVVAWLWTTNPVLVPFALVAVLLVFRSLRVPQLEEAARLDPKTRLANAPAFHDALREELGRARRFRRPLAVLLADLDLLREINNEHGHLAGDAVIVGIADVLRAELRRVDVAARFGGEEFAVLLPETTGEQAVEVADRIRRAVAGRTYGAEGVELRATVSLGVAAFPGDAGSAQELLRRADEALYAAKDAGRDRVRRARPAPVAAG